MRKNRQTTVCLTIIFLISSIPFCMNSWAAGGIVTDGTIGQVRNLKGTQIDIPESYGSRRGGNLFHSFSEFNIKNGQSVIFQENVPNSTENLITRVTGNSGTNIDGDLLVTPDGKANFYLINPNGIAFGSNSFVNVPGSIHLSTAEYLKLKSGQKFSAVDPRPVTNQLFSAQPVAFGFLGNTTKNNGLLKVNGPNFFINEKKVLDIVANHINFQNNNSNLFVGNNVDTEEGGEVRLIAIRGSREVSTEFDKKGFLPLPELKPTELNAGNINLTKAGITVRGNGAGNLSIWGKNVTLKGLTNILVNNTGDINPSSGKGITIAASSLDVFDGSNITSNTDFGTSGKSADIRINLTKNLRVKNGGSISAQSAGVNDAGNIFINLGQNLLIQREAKVTTEIQAGGQSKAGNIQIFAGGDIILKESGFIKTSHNGGKGNLGNIKINSNNMILDGSDLTGLHTATDSEAKAGDIDINIKNNLRILNGSQIDSGTSAQGEGGNIRINAKNIEIRFATITAESKTKDSGNPGNIHIISQDRLKLNKGTISIRNHSFKDSIINSIQPNLLSLTALEIIFKDSLVTTRAIGNQPAASIFIAFNKSLSIDPSFITTESQEGDGGKITIHGGGVLDLKDSAITTAVSGIRGNGGNILISADNLVLQTGLIKADTAAKNARGGDIFIDVDSLISSGSQLNIGALEPIEWKPGSFGLNIIQAAAPNGISGLIQTTTPILNLSGTLANLGASKFDKTPLETNNCSLNQTSNFILARNGGLLPKARDFWLY